MTHALLFVIVTLAAYRLWRVVALDTLPPFAATRKAIERRIEARHGEDWSDGLACAWCSGAWLSTIVVSVVWAVRDGGLPLPGLWYFAVSAGVGILASLVED